MRIICKQKVTEAKLLDWLATLDGFIEGLTSINDIPVKLTDYQRRLILDTSPFLCVAKARQIGFSFARACHGLANAYLRKGYKKLFISMNLDEAKEKIRYVAMLHDSLPEEFKMKKVIDNKMEVEFENGSRLSSVFLPRGRGKADVDLDEMAHYVDAYRIYNASLPVITRGGQFCVGSTHFGRDNLFWQLCHNDSYKEYNRIEIYWWDSPDLCKDVKRAREIALEMTTVDRVSEFGTERLQSIYSNMLEEDFQQEYELSPLDESLAFISLEEIYSCCRSTDSDETGIFDDFSILREVYPDGIFYAGYDVAREKNRSELFVLQKKGDKYYQRMLKGYHNVSFEYQKEQLRDAIEILGIRKISIDATGLGMNLAEDLVKQYGSERVEPVNFSQRVEIRIQGGKSQNVPVKERLAIGVKLALQRKVLDIYPGRELISQIHSIKRRITDTGYIRYDTDKNNRLLTDKFWALGLALWAAGYSRNVNFNWLGFIDEAISSEKEGGKVSNIVNKLRDEQLSEYEKEMRAVWGELADFNIDKIREHVLISTIQQSLHRKGVY